MGIDISALKKKSSTSTDALLSVLNKSQYNNDPRIWSLEGDKVGNGTAIIRFLPHVDEDECNAPFVQRFEYNFKFKSGTNYVQISPSTLGLPCPVKEYNDALWASKSAVKIAEAKTMPRKTQYFSNILVVSDPAHPETEGKVFIFKYGNAIFNMIKAKLAPQFQDMEPVNIFDPWEGQNFRFRMCRADGRANYDNSTFDSSSVLADSDAKILEILERRYNLMEFIDPKLFKPYDELHKLFYNGLKVSSPIADIKENPVQDRTITVTPASIPSIDTSFNNDSEDTMAMFAKLANS